MTVDVKQKWIPFGKELRKLRGGKGLTLAEVGTRLGVSGPQIGNFERATRTPNRAQVDKLDVLYETGHRLREFWEDTRREGRVPDEFRNALAMERKAKQIREYQSILFPGLIQTPDYARTLIRARRPQAPEEDVEELVTARMGRLNELVQRGATLWVVVDEVVVRRPIGSAAILREQLDQVTALIQSGTIRLQVLPLENHPGLCAPYRIVMLDDRRNALFLENARGGEIVDKVDMVSEMSMLFSAMQAEALTTRGTLELIQAVKGQIA
ncbi:helix-turn-helix transcriptional regulator [Nocardiopsis sp. N85]|uniref:helix-turn-helix domain-containing protein n=1 Tax=Nocardiopsis sp. N85 TaxID=3029400 RepID=UPI00237F70A7|nr:helix-turn-helix transcriptional regulator [Nocardiopsis sp. N85]MDE3721864.1 helix-turn-helix transcriptional regulator [Nocardiopsis sp. N85]